MATVHSGFAPAPVALGTTLARQAFAPVCTTRPTTRRRDALLNTHTGQDLNRRALSDVAAALGAHQLAPLVALRLRKGLSQKQLCERTGLPQPHVSRLENGKVPHPDVLTLKSLADALEVTLDEVVGLFRGTAA